MSSFRLKRTTCPPQVFKLPDSYLGIGDKFLDMGKDFNTKDDLVTMLKAPDYADKEVLILDLIRPATGHEVSYP